MKNLLSIKIAAFVTVILFLLFSLFNTPAWAQESLQPEQIFVVNCAGCHPQGGNIIRRGKNLKSRALKRYGVDSVEAISALVTHGKNNMPAYQDRLSREQIEAVSAYVLQQSQTGW